MSTELRNVPGTGTAENGLTQTRFWGGAQRQTCLQVTQRNAGGEFDLLQLTRTQARALAVELLLFAESREVEADT
jgi:hypothetical protein